LASLETTPSKNRNMKVTDIPFNAFLGIRETLAGTGHLMQLDELPKYLNHIGTVHASAQLALAEASSGHWLMQAVPELAGQVLAVVRRVEAKFKSPMNGLIFSRAATTITEVRHSAEALRTKGRAIIPVTIEIVDAEETVGLAATFEWFAQKLR
jgi:acyl-coenzyme A thioesterase PaaI-like protein